LANNRKKVEELKNKLNQNIKTKPLFNTKQYTSDFESCLEIILKNRIKNLQDEDISHLQKQINSFIAEDEKLIIRKSMWDPVIRVYYDYLDINNFSLIKKEINRLLKN